MINALISQIDHENIIVKRYVDDVLTEIGTFQVSVQGIRSSVKVQGYLVDKSLKGDDIDSTFMMYSANVNIKANDIIQRIERDKLLYEVKGSEPKGVGTVMEHRESIIERVANQDEDDE